MVEIFNSLCSYCYQESEGRKSSACPVCMPPLNELARRLPFSHCAQSRLICSVSGLPLNEHNPPMMLPNGRVYGLTVSRTNMYLSRLICSVSGLPLNEHNPPMMLPNGRVYGLTVSLTNMYLPASICKVRVKFCVKFTFFIMGSWYRRFSAGFVG